MTRVAPPSQFNLPKKEPRRPENRNHDIARDPVLRRGKFSYGFPKISSDETTVQFDMRTGVKTRKIFVKEYQPQYN